MSSAATHVARPAQPSPEKGRRFLQTLREALQLFWTVADSWIKRRLLVALALVAGGAVLAALTPVGLKLLIDALAQSESARHHAHGAMLGDRLLFIGPTALVILYAIGQFLTRGSLELRQYTHASAEQRLRRNVGRRLFAHLVHLPLQFHLGRKTGAMGETAEQGIHGYQLLLNHAVYTVLPVFVEFGVVAVVLIHFGQPQYVLILAASSLAYVVAFHRGVTAVTHSTTLVAKSHLDAQAILTDSLLSYETIKYFDAERVVCNRYDRALGRMEIAWRGFYTHRMRNGLTIAAIFATSLGGSLWLAAGDVTRGAMTVGDFVMVNAYILRLVQPLELLGYAVRDITQGVAFLQSLLDLLAEQPEKDRPRTAGERHAARGELTFDRVSFSYQQERSLLRNVSFSVPAGHTVAIVGASGAGKTSIIRLLFRLYAPTSGRILLDGVPTADMPLSELRQAIGVVPQDTVLFDDTIANNIGLGRVGSTMAEIARAARVAHLHETINAMPEGYETIVGERGLRLSGGERQRVAIARAALKAPRIFVFDEATASLDSRTEGEILRNLAAVSAESTTLIIAHRLSTIVHANRIIVLDRGEIVEQGTHAELLAASGIYASMWLAQQGGSGRSADSQSTIMSPG